MFLLFFRFPVDPEKRNSWVKNMNIDWQPGKNDRICSLHFEEKFKYLTGTSKVCLLNKAVPTLFTLFQQPKRVCISYVFKNTYS